MSGCQKTNGKEKRKGRLAEEKAHLFVPNTDDSIFT
jgi:hypothetical protein